jgi:hypothetical protein
MRQAGKGYINTEISEMESVAASRPNSVSANVSIISHKPMMNDTARRALNMQRLLLKVNIDDVQW